ncbi:MAG: hypothetical protein ACLP2J_11130 [Acidimicrobiales bacterium]
MSAALEDLRDELRRLGRVVVAFSGGVDSSLLAKVAHDTLGRPAVLCATALSPSLAGTEELECRTLAEEWDLRWVGVPTDEMEDAAYVANGPDRCARCKSALMAALGPLAASESATVVLGVNRSDLGDHRPGQVAAAAACPGRWSPRSLTFTPSTTVASSAAASGPSASMSARLQRAHRSGPLAT